MTEDRIHQDALRVFDALLGKMNLQKACNWMVSPLPPGLLVPWFLIERGETDKVLDVIREMEDRA